MPLDGLVGPSGALARIKDGGDDYSKALQERGICEQGG